MTPKRQRPARRPLRSLKVSTSFLDFVLDQLQQVAGLRARSMFGGVGLYAEDVFFGIVATDTLFFKVDDRTRPDYEAAGSAPFKPYQEPGITMSYSSVPAAVLEDPSLLTEWASRAVTVAKQAKPPKSKAVRPRDRTKPPR
jgi:DNA transformation protein